jgi:hypothetical protein
VDAGPDGANVGLTDAGPAAVATDLAGDLFVLEPAHVFSVPGALD